MYDTVIPTLSKFLTSQESGEIQGFSCDVYFALNILFFIIVILVKKNQILEMYLISMQGYILNIV